MIHLTKTKETLLSCSEDTSFELQMYSIFPVRQTSWEWSGHIWIRDLCHSDAPGCPRHLCWSGRYTKLTDVSTSAAAIEAGQDIKTTRCLWIISHIMFKAVPKQDSWQNPYILRSSSAPVLYMQAMIFRRAADFTHKHLRDRALFWSQQWSVASLSFMFFSLIVHEILQRW